MKRTKPKALGKPVPAEQRASIIERAIPALCAGTPTDQIAREFGITGRTLRYWLVSDERALDARMSFLAAKLAEAAESIDSADDAFPLARARESFRAWSWIAERRLPEMFGPRQEIRHTGASVAAVQIVLASVAVAPLSDPDP